MVLLFNHADVDFEGEPRQHSSEKLSEVLMVDFSQ
jgi:hypothetical protein